MTLEVVHTFNGEERRSYSVTATAKAVTKRLRTLANRDGWGVRLRGSLAVLDHLGTVITPDGGRLFRVDAAWTVDCSVVPDGTLSA